MDNKDGSEPPSFYLCLREQIAKIVVPYHLQHESRLPERLGKARHDFPTRICPLSVTFGGLG